MACSHHVTMFCSLTVIIFVHILLTQEVTYIHIVFPFILILNLNYHIFDFHSIFYSFVATSSIVHCVCLFYSWFYLHQLICCYLFVIYSTILFRSVVTLCIRFDFIYPMFLLGLLDSLFVKLVLSICHSSFRLQCHLVHVVDPSLFPWIPSLLFFFAGSLSSCLLYTSRCV